MKWIRVIRAALVGAALCLTGAMILQMVIFTYRRRVSVMNPQPVEAVTAPAVSAPAVTTGMEARQKNSAAASSSKASSAGEFSGAAAPSLTDRFMAIRRATHSNNELSVYEEEQVAFSGGETILLTAEKAGEGYVSGMAESSEAYLYGEFSFTITVPEGAGLFPSIWMLNTAGTLLPEIDIYEHVGIEPNSYSGVLHYFNGIKRRAYFVYNFENGMPRQYTVGLSWHKDLLIWTLDGAEVFRTESHVPDKPMYLIANLAVGGDWPGDPDQNTKFPACFTVKIDRLEPETIEPRLGG